MKMRQVLIVLFTILSISSARSQSTLTLGPSKDTYINTVIADQTQGHVQSIVAAGWTYGGSFGQGRSLIGFELCPLPDTFVLVSATLHLFHDYSASHAGHTTNGLNSAKLFQITSPWNESTTWSSQPTYDQNTFAVIPSSNTSSQDFSIDVTGIVSNSLLSSNEIGFYFKLDNEITYRSLVFASKEHPDPTVRPRLEIVYYTDTTWCNVTPNSPNYLETCLENVIIPNVFTPNDDSINDNFHFDFDCTVTSFQIEIFNRWGNRVFESDKADFEWDGTDSEDNTRLSEGTYFYKVVFSDGQKEIEKTGMVSLIR